ncbi:uncharacterized protein LOC134279855 isoform X2 [Saccostrea cucullata]|uniref:uncharacterized protein LOC134279855 isoform X2 n=1 Tax=Saccostrea cuccullata TaxID=36930 RepID=UPI002ED506F4
MNNIIYYRRKGNVLLLVLYMGSIFKCVNCEKPVWVHRVNKCPHYNNLTAWIEASKRLNCFHDLRSADPKEQTRVYHCIPSVFLNETVEFCGRNEPIQAGNCPIYNYRYAANASPSYYNCTNFTSGCPSKMYFSKDVYKHRECIEIDETKRCYVAEVCSHKSDDGDRRTTGPITTTTKRCISISAAVAALLIIILILFTIVYIRYRQKRKRKHGADTVKEESLPLLEKADDGKRDARKVKELPGLSALKRSAEFFHFNQFVTELSTQINRENKLQDLKRLALGVEVTHAESIITAEDFLKFLVMSHSLHENLIYLQVLFFHVNAMNLVTLCMEFGENHHLLYLELKQTSEGDEYIIHHSEAFEEADLDLLRVAVCKLLETDRQRIRIQSTETHVAKRISFVT